MAGKGRGLTVEEAVATIAQARQYEEPLRRHTEGDALPRRSSET